jgi:hypothetical protein
MLKNKENSCPLCTEPLQKLLKIPIEINYLIENTNVSCILSKKGCT